MSDKENIDLQTVAGFGDEWSRFSHDRDAFDNRTRKQVFEDYFLVFPWETLPVDAVGADIGCGSGRWAQVVAPRVGWLHLIDASRAALDVAQNNLCEQHNVTFHQASVSAMPIDDGSLDFVYSLGVLHHVPDTAAAIKSIAAKLKPGAPLLLYLYYAFDNRGVGYRTLWRLSDLLRRIICRLPSSLRYLVSQVLAVLVYWPLSRSARLLERLRILPTAWPLAYYRDKPFYVLRTDALDRFGTALEQRFTRRQITEMLEEAGFCHVRYSPTAPFWCVVVRKQPC